ncbi:MarR family winged helix-turn-helix transcriptional regulator [Arthrobacter halodurans]|uniref:MarR family winged helix-turn-helix transcriptional regulator n=1 Tax=Arthrobacter halodurans TaxID=516699 RepID=A0ABV4ULK7_9MICC
MARNDSTAATPGANRLLVSDLAQDLSFLVARLRSQGSAAANTRLAPLGLKVRSYSVLSLACGDPAPTQRELAEFLWLDPSQIVALVDGLEGGGLVHRETDPSDRRSKLVVGTPRGRELCARARAAASAAEDDSLRALGAAERATLRALLARAAFGPED